MEKKPGAECGVSPVCLLVIAWAILTMANRRSTAVLSLKCQIRHNPDRRCSSPIRSGLVYYPHLSLGLFILNDINYKGATDIQ